MSCNKVFVVSVLIMAAILGQSEAIDFFKNLAAEIENGEQHAREAAFKNTNEALDVVLGAAKDTFELTKYNAEKTFDTVQHASQGAFDVFKKSAKRTLDLTKHFNDAVQTDVEETIDIVNEFFEQAVHGVKPESIETYRFDHKADNEFAHAVQPATEEDIETARQFINRFASHAKHFVQEATEEEANAAKQLLKHIVGDDYNISKYFADAAKLFGEKSYNVRESNLK